jgi:hypothetical protein
MAQDKDDFYRQQAQEAERLADRALLADDRAAWLRLAQSWLKLVRRKPATSPAEAFNDLADRQGTHQGISQREQ